MKLMRERVGQIGRQVSEVGRAAKARFIEPLTTFNPSKREFFGEAGVAASKVVIGLGIGGPLILYAAAKGYEHLKDLQRELTAEEKVAIVSQTLQNMANNITKYQISGRGLESAQAIQERPDSGYIRIGRILRTFYPNDPTVQLAQLDVNYPFFFGSLLEAAEQNDLKSYGNAVLAQRGDGVETKIDLIFGDIASSNYFKIPYEVMIQEAPASNIKLNNGLRNNSWAEAVAKNPGIERGKLTEMVLPQDVAETIKLIENLLTDKGVSADIKLNTPSSHYGSQLTLTVTPEDRNSNQKITEISYKIDKAKKPVERASKIGDNEPITREILRRAFQDAEWSYGRSMQPILPRTNYVVLFMSSKRWILVTSPIEEATKIEYK